MTKSAIAFLLPALCLVWPTAAAPADTPVKRGSLMEQRFGPMVLQLPDGYTQVDDAGAMGDALLTYPKSHPQYRKILEHLGGLKPGEHKPVRPFPPGD